MPQCPLRQNIPKNNYEMVKMRSIDKMKHKWKILFCPIHFTVRDFSPFFGSAICRKGLDFFLQMIFAIISSHFSKAGLCYLGVLMRWHTRPGASNKWTSCLHSCMCDTSPPVERRQHSWDPPGRPSATKGGCRCPRGLGREPENHCLFKENLKLGKLCLGLN